MYNGAWDYPADVRGYTYGVVAELNQKNWALRYGIFGEPSEANGPDIDPEHWRGARVTTAKPNVTINPMIEITIAML